MEDLVGEGTQRDGRLRVGGSVLSQTKILETEAQTNVSGLCYMSDGGRF